MIQLGQAAPDFEAKTTDGRTVKLSDFRGRTLVLYFFPRAFTPGCTIEASLFRQEYPNFQKLGVEVLGVSTDDLETQCAFAEKTGATFPMVGDPDGVIAEKYDVLWKFFKLARRMTFVIDPDGRIQGVFHNELRIRHHVSVVLQAVQRAAR